MSDTEERSLADVSVGINLVPEGSEEVEFVEPRDGLTDAGADVAVVGPETGEALTVESGLEDSDTYEVERDVADVDPDEYDALVVPGGTVGADELRSDEDAIDLLREHVEAGMPTGVICHGPWTLVEADVVDGRTLTSYPSLRTDVENAGGEWVGEEVVTDDPLITSRRPDDLEAFCETLVEEFAGTGS